MPLIGVGPSADSVHAVAGVVAPVSWLSTTLTRVSVGVTAVFVIVQTTLPPLGTATVLPVSTPPWHTQDPGVNPAGPSSASVYEPALTGALVTCAEPARHRRWSSAR